jgi:two-component SAPR family response regulator
VNGPSVAAGKRILVAEDDFIVALDLVDRLQALGATVVGPFHDVATACGALAAARPDAAVLDVKLGREQVYPLADRLVEARVPFIFATGFEGSAIPHRFASVTCLTKPVSSHELEAAFLTMLSH